MVYEAPSGKLFPAGIDSSVRTSLAARCTPSVWYMRFVKIGSLTNCKRRALTLSCTGTKSMPRIPCEAEAPQDSMHVCQLRVRSVSINGSPAKIVCVRQLQRQLLLVSAEEGQWNARISRGCAAIQRSSCGTVMPYLSTDMPSSCLCVVLHMMWLLCLYQQPLNRNLMSMTLGCMTLSFIKCLKARLPLVANRLILKYVFSLELGFRPFPQCAPDTSAFRVVLVQSVAITQRQQQSLPSAVCYKLSDASSNQQFMSK